MESELGKVFRYYRERQFKETPLQTMVNLIRYKEDKILINPVIDLQKAKEIIMKYPEEKFLIEKPENTVFCSTNTPEVQEFIELASVKVETDNIDEQKITKSKWDSLT